MDPITAGLNLLSEIIGLLKADAELLKNANPETLNTYAENRMKLLIPIQDVLLKLVDRLPKGPQ